MANTVISLKKSGTPSAIPVDLANGELAINYADGKIFYKSATGSIQEISGGGGGGNAFGTVNANGTLVVSDTSGDVFSLIPGDGIAIVGDAINDTITISATVVSGGPAYDKANLANITASAAYDQANIATTVSSSAFDKANSSTNIASSAYDQSNTNSTIITASFGKANDVYTVATSSFDQANLATTVAITSFDKVNVVAIAANSYANFVGAASNSWASATFTTIIVGTAAYNQANLATTISSSAFDKANSANVLAYDTGIGANAFTSSTIAGANTAVGTGANAYANLVWSRSNSYSDIVGTSANAFTSATIAGANTAVGAGANAYANLVWSRSNSFISSTIAGANTAVGAGANTVGIAAFNKANTAETIAIAAYNNSNTKLTTSGGTITGDLAIAGNLSVSGNTSYISVENYRVDDPLIYLAGNNYISDIVDIGFVGNYVNSTGQNVHTGLFRNHEDKQYYLFYGYDQEPENNHINPNGNNFTLAVLNADVKTSNLVLGGQNAITWIKTVYDKANSANLLAYNTGIGANAFTSATIAGANTAVGAGANAYANLVWSRSNAFTSATIAGANTAVGAGANAYSLALATAGNTFTINTIAGANTAVGAGANAFASATIAGANTISIAAFNEANNAETIAIAAFNEANVALANATGTLAGDLTLTGDLFVSGGQIGINNTVSTRDKIRLYNGASDGTFAIGMQSGITYGGLNDWAMTFQFSTGNTRGFWWGHTSHTVAQGAMSLTTDGRLTVAKSIRVGYGESDSVDPGANYTLEVGGSFAAQTKSFLITHPSKPDMKLRYGSLEGPENGVYIRGRLTNQQSIELPDYWKDLVDIDTITVNLTPYGKKQDVYVKDITETHVHLNEAVDCFFIVLAERKDVEKLIVEF